MQDGSCAGADDDLVKAGRTSAASTTAVRGRTSAKKVVRSAGVALAWYLGSSAVALAVSSASGVPIIEARPKKAMPIGPTLLLLYIISTKNLKKRARFEGVVPKDKESTKLLADDAHDLAMSWGKPAGRIAFFLVDLFAFFFFFRFSGLDFKKLLTGQGLTQLLSADFWLPVGVVIGTVSIMTTVLLRRFGQGYLRSTAASMLSPMMQAAIVKPAKAVLSVVGLGKDWDLGLTLEERKNRRSSRELRESLSTFQDTVLAEKGGGARSSDPEVDEEGEEGDGQSPPDLKRTS